MTESELRERMNKAGGDRGLAKADKALEVKKESI